MRPRHIGSLAAAMLIPFSATLPSIEAKGRYEDPPLPRENRGHGKSNRRPFIDPSKKKGKRGKRGKRR